MILQSKMRNYDYFLVLVFYCQFVYLVNPNFGREPIGKPCMLFCYTVHYAYEVTDLWRLHHGFTYTASQVAACGERINPGYCLQMIFVTILNNNSNGNNNNGYKHIHTQNKQQQKIIFKVRTTGSTKLLYAACQRKDILHKYLSSLSF